MSADVTGNAVEMLQDAIKVDGGLGFYIVVIRKGGRTESFKGSRKEIDGIHYYSHIIQTLNDDFRQDIDPKMVVGAIPDEVAVILKETLQQLDTDSIPSNRPERKPD